MGLEFGLNFIGIIVSEATTDLWDAFEYYLENPLDKARRRERQHQAAHFSIDTGPGFIYNTEVIGYGLPPFQGENSSHLKGGSLSKGILAQW